MKKAYEILAALFLLLGITFTFILIGYSFLGFVSFSLSAFFLFLRLSFNKIRRIRIAVIILFFVAFFSATVLGTFIATDLGGDEATECDFVIVLGAGIDGEKPSRSLVYRLDKALEYMERYPSARAIVSGGQGKDEDITEALAMERYLISHGVDRERIIKEEKARNTYENMIFSEEIVSSLGGGTVAVISSDYHLFRSRLLAENAGMNPVMISAETSLPVLFTSCFLREVAALVKAYLIFI